MGKMYNVVLHGLRFPFFVLISFPCHIFQKRPYEFRYGVRDERSGADFEQTENREGHVTRGEYRVNLPDGRVQIVTYVADDDGYKATVTYEGEASYPKPSEYSYDARVHDLAPPPHVRQRRPGPPKPHPSPLLPVAVPPHEAFLPKISLSHLSLPAESIRDEVRAYKPPPPPHPVTPAPPAIYR